MLLNMYENLGSTFNLFVNLANLTSNMKELYQEQEGKLLFIF